MKWAATRRAASAAGKTGAVRANPLRVANGVSTGATLTESGRRRTAALPRLCVWRFFARAAKDFPPGVDNLL